MRALIILLAVAMLVLVGAAAANSALTTAGQHETIVNETFTPDSGNITTLNQSNRVDCCIYDRTVTVYDEKGSLAVNQTDYRWYPSNGTIKTLSGGELDGDNSATITYGFSTPTALSKGIAGVFASGFDVAALMVFVLGAGVVLIGIRSLGGV